MDERPYEVNLNWNNGRQGTLSSPVLYDNIDVATPPQFPKGVEGIWSPEHLFVASVSSCLMTTFLAIAENSGLYFSGFSVNAAGKLEKIDGRWMISRITLRPAVEIAREKDRGKAERILRKSEETCLISNSILTEIEFEPEVIVAESVL